MRERVKNYAVAFVPDASRAIDMVARKDYDTILLDVKLSSIDGLSASYAIREGCPNIPVVLTTG